MSKTEKFSYVSLVANLEGFFDKALVDLPAEKRALVEGEFFLSDFWDRLDARQRQVFAEKRDYQLDPEIEPLREAMFNLLAEKGEIELEIGALELMRGTTPTELESKHRQLVELRKQLGAKQREMREAEATAPAGQQAYGKPVSSAEIASAFRVLPDRHKNALWWKERMREAKRHSGLVGCRAAPGRGKRQSFWYPAYIAIWLVEKRGKSGETIASVLREHFPDCSDTADLLVPAKAE